jgi:phosphatidylglycerophosphatase A
MEVSEYLGRKLLRLKGRESSTSLSAARLFATCFGIGYLPLAPGTWASLVTATAWFAIYALFPRAAVVVHVIALACLVPMSWIASGLAARQMGVEDPSVVVIDEVVGQSITLLLSPVGIWWFLGGFALFRFFDILKPPPIRRCERFPGGLGITLDDLVAGMYGGLILWLIHAL